MKKVCVVTGTRAEYGLLKPLIEKINNDAEMKLQLAVTGMHLSPEFGLTYKEIEQDGFEITERCEMLLSSDTPNGIAKSVGLGTIGFADIFTKIVPDMTVILGDRYEAFAAATAAMIHRIPIAHIHGGELTLGAVDDAIRHSITKMSTLHFTSTEEYRKRVIQLGEEPDRVFCVGALGVENIKTQQLMSREELSQSIDFPLDLPYVLVTFHPVTLENATACKQFDNLLTSLDGVREYRILFTKANADTDGRIINEKIDSYVKNNKGRAVAYTSLGMKRYLSALQYSEMVIGNSSSGILEAPSFKIPTVNIGSRQLGRIRAKSVIDCTNSVEAISDAISKAKALKTKRELENIRNPYEKSNTSENILFEIRRYLLNGKLAVKNFYDI
ncbi:UDP-N-acetylglucosamine 2-epimerase (hydrolyzing) [Lachnospiraceae bacterium MD335]|jgi:GDP/UDP-N,N'-diacetylbacillosamine 2-epimerase (hydrolysing)|nr:UDP-N-acetylglucosamine 2-epimerase (hydrolyzing) [Lachnospiraceae bacterium MD335]